MKECIKNVSVSVYRYDDTVMLNAMLAAFIVSKK